MTVIIFLIVLAVLIFVHELGHFIFARANGIRVDAFKIGFGPKMISWKRGETEYGINWIPFGGYVKIFGENPDQESLYGPDSNRSFVKKNGFQQVLVLFAGVLFNFIFAWLLYVTIFATGVTATTDGFEDYADKFENNRIMVTLVQPGSPAEQAGLEIGDVITKVQNTEATDIENIQASISSSNGKPIKIEVLRKDNPINFELSAKTGLVDGKYAVGIAMQHVGDLQLPFFTAIYEGAKYTWLIMKETTIGLYQFIAKIFTGTADFADVAGPVGIAGIVGNAAEMGFTYLLMITAIISINLGIINLVPFPALDGGRILFVLIESVIRRRISPKFANALNAVGFALLMLLMVVVTYRDIAKLIQ